MKSIPEHISSRDLMAARTKIRTAELEAGCTMTAAERSILLGALFPTWSIEYRRDIARAIHYPEDHS